MRRTVALVFATLAVAAVGGCGGGDDDAGDGATGTVRLFSDNPGWRVGFRDVARELKRLKDIRLDITDAPDPGQYEQAVKSSLRTRKQVPDVIKWWSGYRLQDLARTGALEDLTPVWDAMERKGWIEPALKPAFTHEGKVYGLPIAQSYWVFFYGKETFRKAGIEPPRTWEEFLSNARKLKREGIAPFFATVKDRWTSFIWFEEILSKTDPQLYQDVVNNKASYTDPRVTEAMRTWKGLIDQDLFSDLDIGLTDAPAQIKAGKVAMLPVGTWHSPGFVELGMKPDEDYGAFLMPPIEGGKPSVVVESGALAIPRAAPHREAAVNALDSWLDPAVQRPWTRFLKEASANPKVPVADPVIQDVSRQVRDSGAVTVNRYFEATPPAIVENSIDELGKFMVDPSKLDSVLKAMQDGAAKEWANWDRGG